MNSATGSHCSEAHNEHEEEEEEEVKVIESWQNITYYNRKKSTNKRNTFSFLFENVPESIQKKKKEKRNNELNERREEKKTHKIKIWITGPLQQQ